MGFFGGLALPATHPEREADQESNTNAHADDDGINIAEKAADVAHGACGAAGQAATVAFVAEQQHGNHRTAHDQGRDGKGLADLFEHGVVPGGELDCCGLRHCLFPFGDPATSMWRPVVLRPDVAAGLPFRGSVSR